MSPMMQPTPAVIIVTVEMGAGNFVRVLDGGVVRSPNRTLPDGRLEFSTNIVQGGTYIVFTRNNTASTTPAGIDNFDADAEAFTIPMGIDTVHVTLALDASHAQP